MRRELLETRRFWTSRSPRYVLASVLLVGARSYHKTALERTAVRVSGPPSRQPRSHCTVPQRKSGDAASVQAVDADVRRRRTVRTMPSNSPTDAALRRRLTELCVHIPCGGIRGPIQRPALCSQISRAMAVLPRRGLPRRSGGTRRLPALRPVRHLLPGDRRRLLPLGLAGVQRMSRHQRINRLSLGFPPVCARSSQPHERYRRAQWFF